LQMKQARFGRRAAPDLLYGVRGAGGDEKAPTLNGHGGRVCRACARFCHSRRLRADGGAAERCRRVTEDRGMLRFKRAAET